MNEFFGDAISVKNSEPKGRERRFLTNQAMAGINGANGATKAMIDGKYQMTEMALMFF